MNKKYDLIVDYSNCGIDELRKEIDYLVYAREPKEDNTLDILIKVIPNEEEFFSFDDFKEDLDCAYDIDYNPHFKDWGYEETDGGEFAFYLNYDLKPELDFRDEYIQEEILKAWGASRDDIRRHLSAVRNGASWTMHYEFSDVEGWLCEVEESIEQNYEYEDPEDIEGMTETDYIRSKLVEMFGTSDRDEIKTKIENNKACADYLTGSWCQAFGQSIFISEC